VTESNTVTCHDASEVYGYSCFIIVVEESASRSCQLASKVLLPSDDVDPLNVHIDSPLVTTGLLCGSLSSILRPRYMVKIAIP
jgi:hypothetical protein